MMCDFLFSNQTSAREMVNELWALFVIVVTDKYQNYFMNTDNKRLQLSANCRRNNVDTDMECDDLKTNRKN